MSSRMSGEHVAIREGGPLPAPLADREVPRPAAGGPSAEAKAALRVLLVDDDRMLREGCTSMLQVDGYNVTTCGRGDEAIEMLRRRRFDVVLCDVFMTPVGGLEILQAALAGSRETLVVMMTGNPSVGASLEALRAGAWDYLPKPFSATHLQILMGRAAHAVQVARETREMQSRLDQEHRHSDRITLLGASPAFRAAVDLARRVASTDASVMISGESGTGKEVFAQFIHRHSRRASRTLVPVNCAALPEPLLESEMFGHRKGSFTGADRDKPGLLEVANGGTLFLDELTDMSLPLQAKLLRVIQDGVVRRVGSEQHDAVVDVRFISAVNKDLGEVMRNRTVREDLFYRLRVVPIHLPPLRQRQEDVPVLARHFLAHYWARHHRPGEPAPTLTPAAMDALRARPWRGNVRELQNVIEHLAVLAEPGRPIEPEEVPVYDDPTAQSALAGGGLPEGILNEQFHLAKDRLVAHFEMQYLSQLVSRAGGNMSKAARLASVDRTTLYRLMEKHHFRRDVLSDGAD